jgi:hypothetical protein
LPHAFAAGKGYDIRPHVHWLKEAGSSAEVSWQFFYRIVGSVGATAGAWQGPVNGVIAAGNQSVSGQHLLTTFGGIDMTGVKESGVINWRFRRVGNGDAEANAVVLLEFDFHVPLDKNGTIDEYPS